MDENFFEGRMVIEVTNQNAEAISQELDWLAQLLEIRMKLYFSNECSYNDIYDIPPPDIKNNNSPYTQFVKHYNLTFAERAIIILALAPHVKSQLLDIFFVKNSENSRCFTEFGGRNGHSNSAFIPTGDTALFLLAGTDLTKRFSLNNLFDPDHFFAKHDILRLDTNGDCKPQFSSVLSLSQEMVEFFTIGAIRRQTFSHDFPAKRLETEMEWDQLILDPDTLNQIMEIKTWIEYGDNLLDDLALGRKLMPGFRSLFHGPAGTGKTLTASLLGKITDLDVYRIDLSMIISKYIGETEKNLENIFNKAEHKNWILFFDEADALFGKRTNIHDAHDRYANQETSYLLQRIEDYPGVIILASNFKSNLDEAFTRRFQSIIYFPIPNRNERYRLWKNAFSEKTALAADIHLEEIAEKYELSGGAVMNVVRYSTLMALRKKTRVISLEDIEEGIRKELEKDGRSLS